MVVVALAATLLPPVAASATGVRQTAEAAHSCPPTAQHHRNPCAWPCTGEAAEQPALPWATDEPRRLGDWWGTELQANGQFQSGPARTTGVGQRLTSSGGVARDQDHRRHPLHRRRGQRPAHPVGRYHQRPSHPPGPACQAGMSFSEYNQDQGAQGASGPPGGRRLRELARPSRPLRTSWVLPEIVVMRGLLSRRLLRFGAFGPGHLGDQLAPSRAEPACAGVSGPASGRRSFRPAK